MLGRYQLGQLDIREVAKTTMMTTETIEEITPAIKQIAADYARVSPGVNFVADYWYSVLALIFTISAAGSAVGAWFVLKKLK